MAFRFARRLGWTLCAAPLVAALFLVGPGMVSTADGCSGASGYQQPKGWHTLNWEGDTTAPADAVVVLRGSLTGLDASTALAGVTVSLKDAAGVEVPGALALETLETDEWALSNVLVVFAPSAPLTTGASYALHWEIAESAQSSPYLSTKGDATLKTVTAPSVDNAPVAEAPVFGRQPELAGEIVYCSRGATACPPGASFGSEEIQRPTLTLSWSYVEGQSSQYQLTTIEPIAGKGELVAAPPVEAHLAHTTTTSRSVTLRFADDVEEYCVHLVTRDLRDQSESVSDPLCASRTEVAPPESSLLEQALESCLEPPTEALTGAWCKTHSNDSRCPSGASNGGCVLSTSAPSPSWPGLLVVGAAIGLLRRRRQA